MVMVGRGGKSSALMSPATTGHGVGMGTNLPKQPKSWPHLATSCSPGPIKFAQSGRAWARAQVLTGQSCGRVRGHNWLLSASGVTGHPRPIHCYPDACSQAKADGELADLLT